MRIGTIKESFPGEQRTALTPPSVSKLLKLGAQVVIESGLGATIGVDDAEFIKAGAQLESRESILSSCDLVLRVRNPLSMMSKRSKKAPSISASSTRLMNVN